MRLRLWYGKTLVNFEGRELEFLERRMNREEVFFFSTIRKHNTLFTCASTCASASTLAFLLFLSAFFFSIHFSSLPYLTFLVIFLYIYIYMFRTRSSDCSFESLHKVHHHYLRICIERNDNRNMTTTIFVTS